MNKQTIAIVGVWFLVLGTQSARGQTLTAFGDLTAQLKLGDRVYVTDSTGVEARGRLTEVTPSTMRLWIDGTERQWTAANLREVGWHGDSIRNGGLIGLAVGGGIGLVGGLVQAYMLALGGSVSDDPAAALVLMPITGMAAGFGIGAGLDALVTKRATLYRAPNQRQISIAPLVTRETKGARIAFRF